MPKPRVRTRVLTGLLTTLLVTTLTACGGAAGGGDSSTLKVAVTTPTWNAGFATFLLSQAEGYFEDEGIDVEFTLPPSGTQAAQQVIAGGADIALVTPEPVIIGATKGTDLTYFASYYGDWIYGLAAVDGSGISDVSDLKGKRIGVTNVSSSGATFARVALQLAGLGENDATLVPIGVGAQQVSAIKDGQVDALALWDTQYQIVRNAGIRITDLPVEEMTGMFGGGFVARKSRLDADRDAFAKFGRAFAKGVVYAQANPEAAIQAMWQSQPDTRPAGGTSEADGLAQQVKVLQVRLAGLGVQEGEEDWGTIDPDRVRRSIDFAEKAGLIDKRVEVDQILDPSLLPKINDFSREEVLKQASAKK
ncbi:ABC transporter substrate-binding protein [Actinophytocola algeriensis]|uniref:NitT/TauT family transport system substrate-binding protein n=1 Tax=Actinophytocola algeriensis TaxID=1768010 RepID=A0A7W7VG07_9PSEU|nr:ABC transporter substrate-binding protein [Actinophytocola algeriensis]MBB4908580.1 NitT/TauT family transport system substrate-binding protein [Actinophytocola algeriensis]MBE1475033.1 NitT/TauT family transport system substrate-binding protein [Actinophytocola algeriensis]